MKKIRVLIVEDSAVVRQLLQIIISSDQRLEVAGAVECAEDAIARLEELKPDVISMDIRLPGMNGFEATQRIMRDRPTPIVVCAASVHADDLKISMNALRAGALAVVEKPVGTKHADYAAIASRLCTQLAIMSEVKVVRQRPFQQLQLDSSATPARSYRSSSESRVEMVGITASTGGPNALSILLKELPRDFPVPILLVQHIVPSFLEGFVTWLGTQGPLPTKTASDGEIPRPGTIYLPPAENHLRIEGGKLRLDRRPPVCFQRPSGTVLFHSMASDLGPSALGVLLTGMGDDGAEGLTAMKLAGAHTIAESEATAVVYGMPKAAVALGGVSESLPLQQIAPRIVDIVRTSRLKAAA